MKKTALTEIHEKLGAKMVDFAGFLMPIQYHSIRAEHLRVRNTVGVFDVSHMGEFIVTGKDREAFVDRMTVNDVKNMAVGQAQYTCMCKPDGGIVDDLLIYKFADHIMIVVNAANIEKDWNWFTSHIEGDVKMENASDRYSLIAVQGRHAPAIIQKLADRDVLGVKYYTFVEGKIEGKPAIISRTGYTGEDGFELYVENQYAVDVWNALFRVGKEYEIEAVGLGARDSLRLEMKMCLYGNDIDETTNPIEAGLGWITKLDKGEFVGRSVMLAAKEKGTARKLVAIELEGNGFPRQGYSILDTSGNAIGKVTSGTVSPILNKGIALGYVPTNLSKIGTELLMDCRGSHVKAKVVKPPFYTRPY